MKKLLLCGLLLLCGCASLPIAFDTYQSITMDEAMAQYQNEPNAVLLDVRTYEEYEAGHIPGAINITNENIQAGTYELRGSKDQIIYVYCRSGNRSKQASEVLAKDGFTNIIECGGIIDYDGELERY
ncbi:MAG: rhodanese-like domain-containing protein [Longicatena sp.]|nr:rhodanese-like domain-containing protein [Longicatena sp.]